MTDNEPLAPSQRRLQRPPDFTGARLTRFSQVVLRHGLPGAVLALLCLGIPEMRTLLTTALHPLLENLTLYLSAGLLIAAGLCAYAWRLDRQLNRAAVIWILYLLALSCWEEWVFRVALPYYVEAQGFELQTAVILSNIAFGAVHYFTLRWKWPWCVAAILGGLALSNNFHQHGDIALIVALHWVATFINTPRMPGREVFCRG